MRTMPVSKATFRAGINRGFFKSAFADTTPNTEQRAVTAPLSNHKADYRHIRENLVITSATIVDTPLVSGGPRRDHRIVKAHKSDIPKTGRVYAHFSTQFLALVWDPNALQLKKIPEIVSESLSAGAPKPYSHAPYKRTLRDHRQGVNRG